MSLRSNIYSYINNKGVLFSLFLTAIFMSGFPVSSHAQTTHDMIGEGIQLIQSGKLTAAKAQLSRADLPHKGEAIFLAARIAEYERKWTQAMALYRQYLSEDPFSVHRLEARAAFALLRAYRSDPLLADFLYLIQLRDQNAVETMQQASSRLYASHPTQPLAIRGQILMAHTLLEHAQQPYKALDLYLKVADATASMEADWYIQATFGAVFSALRTSQNTMARDLFNQLQVKLDSSWANRNSLLARSWQQRLNAMAFMLNLQPEDTGFSGTPFLWGIGARLLLDNPVGSGQNFTPIWETLSKQGLPVRSVTLWITQNSDWHWLRKDLLRGAHANGYIPMINYWFFGDKISPDYVQANRKRYLDEVKNKLIPLLQDLPQAYLILEPEFNKQGIESWDGWDPLMLEVIALIRQGAPQVKIGLGLGDWDQPGSTPSYASAQKSIETSDFVASMLMLSSYTERVHSAPDWSAWVRALRLGERLQQRFNKPWMLAYLSIASQPNWEAQQANELQKLNDYLPMLQKLGLFALNWFSLTDEPQQQGWFADAEQSFGLLSANYQPKASLEIYKQLVDKHSHNDLTPELLKYNVTKAPTPVITPLKINAEFSHWAMWELTIAQGDNLWEATGIGDSMDLNWHGQMLPNWANSGPISVTLKLNGQIVQQSVAPWDGTLSNPSIINESLTLSTWQTWQKEPRQNLKPSLLGHQGSGSIEIVISGASPKQLSALHVGLIDSEGFSQTLSSSGYIYSQRDKASNNDIVAINIPLNDFQYSWVKYEDGIPEWREHPIGKLAIVLQNSGPSPIPFEVRTLHCLLP
ncbi:tetratricopeptide repeat protein [Photobacterium satsumensis]|uniref:tetratricopeptide repeat protein n=1 Tax=Photobacterium satsumensis TaxID=2910239 RepID=UPI003D10002F